MIVGLFISFLACNGNLTFDSLFTELCPAFISTMILSFLGINVSIATSFLCHRYCSKKTYTQSLSVPFQAENYISSTGPVEYTLV